MATASAVRDRPGCRLLIQARVRNLGFSPARHINRRDAVSCDPPILDQSRDPNRIEPLLWHLPRNGWLDEGLVDELTLIVAPVMLGGGKRPFEGFTKSLELEHIGVRQSPYATFIDYRVK
jgi:RibD C-terminal domain